MKMSDFHVYLLPGEKVDIDTVIGNILTTTCNTALHREEFPHAGNEGFVKADSKRKKKIITKKLFIVFIPLNSDCV